MVNMVPCFIALFTVKAKKAVPAYLLALYLSLFTEKYLQLRRSPIELSLRRKEVIIHAKELLRLFCQQK